MSLIVITGYLDNMCNNFAVFIWYYIIRASLADWHSVRASSNTDARSRRAGDCYSSIILQWMSEHAKRMISGGTWKAYVKVLFCLATFWLQASKRHTAMAGALADKFQPRWWCELNGLM